MQPMLWNLQHKKARLNRWAFFIGFLLYLNLIWVNF